MNENPALSTRQLDAFVALAEHRSFTRAAMQCHLSQPAFSAALTAFVEAHYPDDATKNSLCQTVPFPDGVEGYPASVAVSMMNQFKWSQDKALRQWVRSSRLDGFGNMIAALDPADTEKMAVLARFKQSAQAAMANVPRLMGAPTARA